MSAPEYVLQSELASPVTSLTALYVHQVPRNVRLPFAVVSLIDDTNDKVFLSLYGGAASLQLDIYARDDSQSAGLRSEIKAAIRDMRGIVDGLKITSVVVTGENAVGVEPAAGVGTWRHTMDIRFEYTEV